MLASMQEMEKEFENKPVVGVHKVDPLWHLHLARPDVTKLVKNDAVFQ